MADKNSIIAASLSLDTGGADKSTKDLKDQIVLLRKELEQTKVGSAEQVEAFKKLKDAQGELTTNTKQLNQVTSDSGGFFQGLKEGLTSTKGAAGDAAGGVVKLSETFIALLANPVVLVITGIVAAFTFLYKAFTNTFEGGEKVEQIFSGIAAAAKVVLDRVFDVGTAIIKFFSGDFKGALADAKQAVTGIGDAITATYNQVAALTKQSQDLHKEQLANDLDAAKRQKDLATLRAEAFDEDVPIAKRLADLKTLQAASVQNAKEDLDLAKRTADNKIALLSIGTDAAKKNQDEINKIRIEQLQGETDNANELRAIGKQITNAQKSEAAERKAASDKALEEAKKRAANYQAYVQELQKLEQENQLAGIADANDRAVAALKIAQDNQNAAFKEQLDQHKINRAQYDKLLEAEEINASNKIAALQKDLADKKEKADNEFQVKLAEIASKIQLDGITDNFDKQRLQNAIEYAKSLADAEKQYANDSGKLQQYKQAIDKKLQADQDRVDAADAKDKAKKDFDAKIKANKGVLDDPKATAKAKFAALDDDVKANKAALDAKTIDEATYTENIDQLTKARIAIKKQEQDTLFAAGEAVASLFDGLSEAVGKQTAAGKAFAIASATIATIESAVKSFNALADIPIVGPALGAVAAAAAIVSGINNVRKIVAVQVPGQGSGGASTPSVSVPAAPVAPTQQSTRIDQASVNAVGNAAAGGVNQNPVRAYVISGEGTTDQEKNARLDRASKFGR